MPGSLCFLTDIICILRWWFGTVAGGGDGSGDGDTDGGSDGEGDLDLLRDKDGKSDGDGKDDDGKSGNGGEDDDALRGIEILLLGRTSKARAVGRGFGFGLVGFGTNDVEAV
ncbi:hypothetical protein Tco_0088204 [Tanacetum coccineum]